MEPTVEGRAARTFDSQNTIPDGRSHPPQSPIYAQVSALDRRVEQLELWGTGWPGWVPAAFLVLGVLSLACTFGLLALDLLVTFG